MFVTFQNGSTTTLSGRFTATGGGTNNKYLYLTSSYTGPFTLSLAAGTVNSGDLYLQNSTAAGGATWYAGNTSVDAGGNSGWIFADNPTGPRYWVGGSGTWNSTSTAHWSVASNGPPGASLPTANQPAVFDDGSGTNPVITLSGTIVTGDLDITYPGITFTGSGPSLSVFGNLNISSGTTWTAAGSLTLASTYSNTATTGNTVISSSVYLNGAGGTYQLQDNLRIASNSQLVLVNGTLDINGQLVSAGTFDTGTGFKTLLFNAGNIELSGSPNAWLVDSPPNFTITAGAGTGYIRLLSNSAKTFSGGGFSYPAALVNAGSGALSIAGNNTFIDIQTPALPTALLFAGGSTTTLGQFSATGSRAGVLTIGSINPGTQANLVVSGGVVSVSNTNIQDSNASGAVFTAYASAGNRNLGDNAGWQFAPSGLHPLNFGGLVISGGIDLF